MISDALISGHILLADWAFLIAAVAFLALAVLAIARSRPRPVDGHTEARTVVREALPWLALGLVAFGLLVL